MTQKIKNPLAQSLGLVFQDMRDKMGGVSSSQIASMLGLAASHYRMIEAGSAILQPPRAIKVVQTFDKIEFAPLCQVLVSQQIIDSVKNSIPDMKTSAELLAEATPGLAKILTKLIDLFDIIAAEPSSTVARHIESSGLKDELILFLTTAPSTFTSDQINDFMSPTYQYPISGQLYSKIGNILQGVAPFYLDTVLQLIDGLKDVTPRVTATELAKWEAARKNRFSHIIGIIRDPAVMLDFSTFDYSYLWDDSFKKILIVYRDAHGDSAGQMHSRICDLLRKRFESERVRYERELETFDQVLAEKLRIEPALNKSDEIDEILCHGDMPMNNLWAYVMSTGYVVPFIDNASVEPSSIDIYGTSLGYDETCDKLIKIRRLCSEIGFGL
jgi:hypothetical protein